MLKVYTGCNAVQYAVHVCIHILVPKRQTKGILQHLVIVAYTCVHTFIEVVDVELIGPPQWGGCIGFLDEQ